MNKEKMRIALVAPGSKLDQSVAEAVAALAAQTYGTGLELWFHPQCFLMSGHFAGKDTERADAFVEVANDPSFDAVWIARGGYGACRIAGSVVDRLRSSAREKTYLGYSDAGALLAALYRSGFKKLAHAPMPTDIRRDNGDIAVKRSLRFLVESARDTLEPSIEPGQKTAAFNIMILSLLLGTPIEPDLSGHVLMLEEVNEYMYRIDRAMFHITSQASIHRVVGIKLGRCSAIPPNDPDFAQTEEEVVQHWCTKSGIPYLGRADIGHDVENKIVPFGSPWWVTGLGA